MRFQISQIVKAKYYNSFIKHVNYDHPAECSPEKDCLT